jgi:hypothetical protein
MRRLIIGLMFVWATTASASILYGNGPSNQLDGANISTQTVADDFTISSSVLIHSLSFFVSPDFDPFPQFSNFVAVSFLNDVNGSPGGFPNTSYIVPTFTDTGNQIVGTEEYRMDLVFSSDPNSSLFLDPGTYWLAVSISPNGDLSQSIYWDTTSETHGSSALATSLVSLGGPWAPALSGTGGTDLAFTISGETVPEVGTFSASCVTLTALAAVAGWSSRRRRKCFRIGTIS